MPRVTAVQLQSVSSGKTQCSGREMETAQGLDEKTVKWARKELSVTVWTLGHSLDKWAMQSWRMVFEQVKD